MNNIFNTSFEVSLRILIILNTVQTRLSIDRITALDFIATYGKDFGVSEYNLHGDNDYRFSEYTSKREKIIVRTQCGTITMSRKIGENKIEVSSNDKNVPSRKYATRASRTNYDKTINSVWLSLIGINDLHLIISNENYKKQILSWRTFSHMFMLTETKIISEYSAILSGRDTSNTAVIASLIFLLSGQDFAERD